MIVFSTKHTKREKKTFKTTVKKGQISPLFDYFLTYQFTQKLSLVQQSVYEQCELSFKIKVLPRS